MQQSSNLSRYLKIGLGSTAISLVIMAGAANAQQTQAQTAKPAAENASGDVQLNTINVKTVNPQDITSRPAPVSTISKTEIKLNGREKLDTVLRETPGVFTRINGSNPGVAVNIRGFEGSGRVNMMIDGAPQTFRTTAHDAQGYSYIDPNLLSSVDITRGAVTTEGGSGLAGSVNFKTLGVDDVLMEGKDKGVLGRASWGSNGVGFSEMLAGAMRVNEVGIVAALSRRDSNDYKNGDGITQNKTGQEMTSGLFKTEFGFAEDHKLTLGGVIYNNKYGTSQTNFMPVPPTIDYDLLLQNRTFTANYVYKPADNDLIDLAINGYFNSTKLTYVGGNSPTLSSLGREIKNESIGFSVANTSRFTVNDLYIDWKYGVEYNHDNTGGVKVGVNPVDSSMNRGAAFTQVEWNYDRLQVLTGLRYDFYKLDGTADSGIPGFEDNGMYSANQSKGLWNPKVTLAYNVTDWLQPYVTYSQSMRAPTLQETMIGGTHPGGTASSYVPNPYLAPEEQRGWDIGLNMKHDDLITAGDTIRFKANYFDMDVKNYIAAQRNTTFNKLQFVNLPGTSRVKGFELETHYNSDYVFGSLSYTHNKSDLPSQTPGLGASQYLPDDVFAATLGGYFFDKKLSAGVKYSYVSSGLVAATDARGNLLPPTKSDSYDLVDIFATYKFNENVDLSLKVTNLFDKTYTPALSTSGSGQGRTFVVATQFQF